MLIYISHEKYLTKVMPNFQISHIGVNKIKISLRLFCAVSKVFFKVPKENFRFRLKQNMD
jgi:hypothetical protein